MGDLAGLLDWLGAHPGWAGLGVFLIAFGESLALVGLILPGAALMFGIGALVGTGALELFPTLVWAGCGAIAGDGVSYWLGRRYGDAIMGRWPFRRYPALLGQATDFFHRHGGKSIVFGRFIGPIRPVIPLVAGIFAMPAGRFLFVNVLSGVAWAPVYVLPGAIFTTTLGLAAEIATQLAVLIGLIILLALIAISVGRGLFDLIHPHTHEWTARILGWSRLHPILGELPASLLDPHHPEARGVSQLALLLVISLVALLWIIEAVGHPGLLVNLDLYWLTAFRAIQLPGLDAWLHAIAALAAPSTNAAVFAIVLLLLGVQRQRAAALHWIIAGGFAAIVGVIVASIPPSSHATTLLGAPVVTAAPLLVAMALYGFLALMIGRELRRGHQLLYSGVALFGVTLLVSHLYRAQALPSSLVGATLFAIAWATLFGLAYRRHVAATVRWRPLLLGALATASISAAVVPLPPPPDAITEQPAIAVREWSTTGWRSLPTWRADLRGEHRHPLDLQYAGDPNALSRALAAAGWRSPASVSATSWLSWFSTTISLDKRPVLPQVHGNHHEQLRFVRADSDGQVFILRLWKSGYAVAGSDQPIWIGNVTTLVSFERLGLTVPRTGDGFVVPLETLISTLPQWVVGERVRPAVEAGDWRGAVVLLAAPQ